MKNNCILVNLFEITSFLSDTTTLFTTLAGYIGVAP